MPLKHIAKTRKEPSASTSKLTTDAPLWLQEQVYAPKKHRTIDLVKQSIESLLKEHRQISLASIVITSKTLDPTGQGISESAVLNNEEARMLYEQHRTWKGSSRSYSSTTKKRGTARISTKVDRNQEQARQRYLRLSKVELVDRLLTAEYGYAEQEQRWLGQQDEILTWRLRTEAAETQLKSSIREQQLETKRPETSNVRRKVTPSAIASPPATKTIDTLTTGQIPLSE